MQLQFQGSRPNSPPIQQGTRGSAALTGPEDTQAENHAIDDSSLRDLQQVLAKHAGIIVQVFMDSIGSLKQKIQILEAANQEIPILKANLEAKEKECEALRQRFDAHKLLQAKDKKWPPDINYLELLIPQLKEPAWEIRAEAASKFSTAAHTQVEQHIIPLLKDPAWQVRQTAIYVLDARFSAAQLEQEVAPLLNDTVLEVRQTATRVLDDRKPPQYRPLLHEGV